MGRGRRAGTWEQTSTEVIIPLPISLCDKLYNSKNQPQGWALFWRDRRFNREYGDFGSAQSEYVGCYGSFLKELFLALYLYFHTGFTAVLPGIAWQLYRKEQIIVSGIMSSPVFSTPVYFSSFAGEHLKMVGNHRINLDTGAQAISLLCS